MLDAGPELTSNYNGTSSVFPTNTRKLGVFKIKM